MPPREGVYGLLAEFNTPSELVHATEMAHRAGYRRMECYTPYPVEEAAEALRFHKTRVPMMCLLGGLAGLTTGFLLQTWINVWGYPLNIRAMPLFSWPAILFAGLSTAFGMIAQNGLPQLYHPLFNAPNFASGATTDKFFLCLEAHDPRFEPVKSREFLEQFSPVSIVEVDH
jgi:vacuolar-type H+-ATPase subunit I/STV1